MQLRSASLLLLCAALAAFFLIDNDAAESRDLDTSLEAALRAAPAGYTLQREGRAGKPKEIVICILPATEAPIRVHVWVHVGPKNRGQGSRQGVIRLDDGSKQQVVAPLGFEEASKGNPNDIHQYLVTVPAGFKGGHLNMTWSGSDWAIAAVQQFVYMGQ